MASNEHSLSSHVRRSTLCLEHTVRLCVLLLLCRIYDQNLESLVDREAGVAAAAAGQAGVVTTPSSRRRARPVPSCAANRQATDRSADEATEPTMGPPCTGQPRAKTASSGDMSGDEASLPKTSPPCEQAGCEHQDREIWRQLERERGGPQLGRPSTQLV